MSARPPCQVPASTASHRAACSWPQGRISSDAPRRLSRPQRVRPFGSKLTGRVLPSAARRRGHCPRTMSQTPSPNAPTCNTVQSGPMTLVVRSTLQVIWPNAPAITPAAL
ncbi:hypothetical protein IP84_16035 [beta proteobacterium AAP99]|nr:hypothetical protein IP84_16035 [beta proteobacterium AAP99]